MLKRFLWFGKRIYDRFIYDMIPSKGAETSFYLLLSFFPFLIFLITMISYIPLIHLNLYIDWLSKVMPTNAYSIVNYIINKAISDKSTNLLIVSFVITFWSATSGVKAIIRGINRAYDQEETRSYFKVTAISILFTFEIVLLITFSLVLVVYGHKISVLVIDFFGLNSVILFILNWTRYLTAVITIFLIFLSLYKYTPNQRLCLKDILPGTLISAFGWILSSMIFSYYANNFVNYRLLYGSIGGIIALLSWLYLSSMVILIGAEVNATFYFRKYNKCKIKPPKY